MQRIVLLAALLLCLGNVITAQTTALKEKEVFTERGISATHQSSDLQEIHDNNWSLYSDEEHKVYYIDFETLKVNLSDIIVKNDHGKVLLKDDVFELPVNTIYEIDFNKYGKGTYHIELRSFTGVIRKSISIN